MYQSVQLSEVTHEETSVTSTAGSLVLTLTTAADTLLLTFTFTNNPPQSEAVM